MDKIICLVGESGSGKTTLCQELEKGGYNIIKSYTTRKPRHEGEYGLIFTTRGKTARAEGIKYIYKRHLDSAIQFSLSSSKNIIAYTFYDGEHYFATKEQYQGKGTSIYVIDPVGIQELLKKVKDAEIAVIYLKTERWIRACRMWHRKYKNSPSIWPEPHDWGDIDGEIKQRINHDRKAFEIVQCSFAVDANRKVEEVLEDIKEIIRKR